MFSYIVQLFEILYIFFAKLIPQSWKQHETQKKQVEQSILPYIKLNNKEEYLKQIQEIEDATNIRVTQNYPCPYPGLIRYRNNPQIHFSQLEKKDQYKSNRQNKLQMLLYGEQGKGKTSCLMNLNPNKIGDTEYDLIVVIYLKDISSEDQLWEIKKHVVDEYIKEHEKKGRIKFLLEEIYL